MYSCLRLYQFVRAEREGEWALHLLAVKHMLPYFFAAGHIHYARYGLCYLRCMEKLTGELLEKFLKGQHVQRHQAGIWNGIWTDMMIESTFMRYGHGPGGIVGITLNQLAVQRWALSLHTCSRLMKDVAELMEDSNVSVTTHKEELPSRIKADQKDRQAIRVNSITALIHLILVRATMSWSTPSQEGSLQRKQMLRMRWTLVRSNWRTLNQDCPIVFIKLSPARS